MEFVELTEVLGNVGEFLGSIAVLVTLVYLAVQVRHSRTLLEENRKVALSQVHAAKTDVSMRQEEAMMDGRLSNIVAKTRDGTQAGIAKGLTREDAYSRTIEALARAERLQLISYNQMHALELDNLAYQDELGLLNEESQLVLQAATRDRDFQRYRFEVLDIRTSPRLRRTMGMAPLEAGSESTGPWPEATSGDTDGSV